MKTGKGLGILIGMLLLILIGMGAIASYPRIYEKVQQNSGNYFEEEDFLYRIAQSNYTLYWKLKQQGAGEELTPLQTFWPDYEAPEAVKPSEITYAGTGEYVISYDGWDYDYERENIYSEVQHFNNSIRDYYYNMKSGRSVYFWAKDNTNGTVLSNMKPSLKNEIEEKGSILQPESQFKYYIKLNYDKDGIVQVEAVYGASMESQALLGDINMEELMYRNNSMSDVDYYGKTENPKDMTVVLATDDSQANWYYGYWRTRMSFMDNGFGLVYFGALGLVLLLGLLLPLVKPLGIGRGISRVIPFELAITGLCMVTAMVEPFTEMAFQSVSGDMGQSLIENSFTQSAAGLVTYGANLTAWFFLLGCTYLLVLSLRQIFTMGPKQYFLKKCWCIRFTAWCFRGMKALFFDLGRVDLSEKSNKMLLRTIFANFVILTLICCFWFFGVFGLIIYSIILFLIIKSRIDDAKTGYQKLMNYIRKMKDGRLDLTIDENLDVFEPMKQELQDLSSGMQAAVEREMESQRVTSAMLFDAAAGLQEPLERLLQDTKDILEEQTEEGRRRLLKEMEEQTAILKPVIERLKNASSASAQSSRVEAEPVDISALIRQVQFELSEQAEAAQISFRLQLPQEKVLLTLDSDKTYQIFDILLHNILKYGHSGSRAYITVKDMDNRVEIILKNTSANELEGLEPGGGREKSGGLNTALARSLAELMGGTCETAIDGDLYKTILVFHK